MTSQYFEKLIMPNNGVWITNSTINFTLTSPQQQTKNDKPSLVKPIYVDYQIYFQDDGTIATYINNIGDNRISLHSINPSSIINNDMQKIYYTNNYTNNKPIYTLAGNKLSFISTYEKRNLSWDLDFSIISPQQNGIYVSNQGLGLLDLKFYFSFGQDNILSEITDTFKNKSSNIYSLIENTTYITNNVKTVVNNKNLRKILNQNNSVSNEINLTPCNCESK